MIKISEAVEKIIRTDEIAFETMVRGIMNFSSYARKIRPEVEHETLKDVKDSSIIVSLSRLAKKYEQQNVERLMVRIDNLTVCSDLIEVTYEKTSKNIQKVRELYDAFPQDSQNFFTLTHGISEINFIAQRNIILMIKEVYKNVEPTLSISGLTGVSVRFSPKYLNQPNVIFEISKRLAIRRVNIVEVVSTTTELTFIIDKKDTQTVTTQLSKLL